MILVDTTVLIDTFKGVENEKIVLFKKVIQGNLNYGISEYTYLEILQGAKNSKEYNRLNEYLLDMDIYLTSIEYGLSLLHNDRDFDAMDGKIHGLIVYK